MRVGQAVGARIRLDWLAENEACDVYFDSPLSTAELNTRCADSLAGLAIDVACTYVHNRRKKLLISDMDSTIIEQECIDELGDAMGLGQEIKEITATVIRGELNFSAGLRQRIALMKGMHYSALEQVYEKRITLKPGARTLVQTMRHHGVYCILVSGGFSFFTQRIAERVGFHNHQANELLFSNGILTGEAPANILGRSAKQETLTMLCQEKNLSTNDVLAVGDGANDIDMIEAAGLGVALHAADSVKQQADVSVDHGDLTALLYMQGYRKSEFIMS